MIQYPLILLDEDETIKHQMVIVVAKPIISFEKPRLQSNLELIGMKFCDSDGKVLVLAGIKKLKRDYNPLHLFFNSFRFNVFGEYQFRLTNETIGLSNFKRIATNLMKRESVEDVWYKYSKHIQDSKNYEEVIGNFGCGLQT